MKIKIICLEEEKNVSFKNASLGLEVLDSEQFNSKYYKVGKNIIEVSYLIEENLNIEEYNFKNNADIIVVLVKSFEEKNIDIIKRISSKYNTLIIAGDIDLSNKYIKSEFNNLNNVMIINELKEKGTIDFKLLNIILNNKEIFCSLNFERQRNTILIDNNESIGKVVLSLLKQFNYIQNNKDYNLYLYSKEEVGIPELAYLEDPIKEYIYDEATFKIDTFINEDIIDNGYFVVLTAK